MLVRILTYVLAIGLSVSFTPVYAQADAVDAEARRADGVFAPPSTTFTIATGVYYEGYCVNPASHREIRWVKVTDDFADAVCRNTENGNQGNAVRFTCASSGAQPTVWVYDSYFGFDGDPTNRYRGVGGVICQVHTEAGQ